MLIPAERLESRHIQLEFKSTLEGLMIWMRLERSDFGPLPLVWP